MSQLATNPNALAQVLQMVCSPDTEAIKRGEKEIAKFVKKETCIAALGHYCATATDVATRLQAALLLKKNVAKHFKKFDAVRQSQLKAQLLMLMTQEPEKAIATALAGSVAKLAKSVMNLNGAWPELFGMLMTLQQDQNEAHRALNFNLLGQMAEHLAEKLRGHMDTIAQMLVAGCQDASNNVKKQAMLACSAFLSQCSEFDEVEKLKCILTPMLNVMNTCLQNGDEESACEGLEVVMECASMDKPLINDHLEMLIPFLLAITQAPNLEAKTKNSASLAVMNIVESRPKLLASKNLIAPILTSVAQIIASSEGSACGSLYTMPSAVPVEDEKDDEEDESYEEEMGATQSAQCILNTMAIKIPSKFFTEPALAMASQCMANPDPKMRKAGAAIVGIITEGCSDSMKPILDKIMPAMLSALADPDQNVREVTAFALGQFSEYLQPEIGHYHQAVFPALAAALEDSTESVRNTACYVLEMFVEPLQKETLRPHLPRLMQQLAIMLQSPSRTSQEMALSGIGACAVTAETDFSQYTPVICGLLTQLINLTDEKQFSLRGRSIECLGHIAVAVGAETFSPYFEACMHSAMNAYNLDDDSLKEHTYVLIANLAKVMGESGRLTPYFHSVIPMLIEVVTEPEILEGSDDEDDDDDEDAGSQDLQQAQGQGAEDEEEGKETSYYLNTAEGFVNGKKAALTALGALAEHTGAAFGQYLGSVLSAVCNPEQGCSVDSQHEDIRAESLEILRYLFLSMSQSNGVAVDRPPKTYATLELPEQVKTLACVIINQCLNSINSDEDKKPVACALDTIGFMIEKGSAALLMVPVDPTQNPDWSGPVGGVLIELLVKLLQQATPCQQAAAAAADAGGGEDDCDDDHDEIVIDSVSELIGTLAKHMGPAFETYFERMLPLLLKYCKPGRPYTDLSMALGCFGEVVAELGGAALKYQNHLLPICQQALAHEMEGVRRNAVFLIGHMVESTGTALSPYFNHILSWVHPICIRPESKKAFDAGGADVDNAISCVARMIKASKESVPLAQVLPVMLAAMPLQSDFTEGSNIFSCFMALLQSGDATTLSLLPQVLVTFAHTLVHESKYEDECKAEVASFLRSSISLPHMQEAMQQLPPEVQSVLAQALN